MKRWRKGWSRRGLFGLCLMTIVAWLPLAAQTVVPETVVTDSVIRAGRDTVALPSLNYSMRVGKDTLMWPDTAAVWRRFFAELDSLRAGKDTVISIVQLGDSHIQAGHFSGQVMREFHRVFGNAGRGGIAPFKLGKSNEPDDYFIKSDIKDWICGKCIQHERKTPIGIGGIGIRSFTSSIHWDVIITPVNGAGYAFNRAILYRGDKAMPFLPTGRSKSDVRLASANSLCAPGVMADTLYCNQLVDTLFLQSSRRKVDSGELLPASTFKNLYYGLSLTNGSPGILYHGIGVNGAMFTHYTDTAYVKQLALLQPALLIISLGTNETFGRRFQSEEFEGQVKQFLVMVKRYLPETAILLTTPPECYKRIWVNKKRQFTRNTQTEVAASTLRKVAKEEGVACWDLFQTTGGKQSCKRWLNQHLLGRDRIHFTREGYHKQGLLLFRALMQAFNQFE